MATKNKKRIVPFFLLFLFLLTIEVKASSTIFGEIWIFDRKVDNQVLTGFKYEVIDESGVIRLPKYDNTEKGWKVKLPEGNYKIVNTEHPEEYQKAKDIIIRIESGKEIVKIYPKHQHTEKQSPFEPYVPPTPEPKKEEEPKIPEEPEKPKEEPEPLTPYVPEEPKPEEEQEILLEKPTPQSLLDNPPKPGEPFYDEYLKLIEEMGIPKLNKLPQTNVEDKGYFYYFIISVVFFMMALGLLILRLQTEKKK